MPIITILCLAVALVLFVLASMPRWRADPTPYYPSLVAAGLAFWVLSVLLPMIIGR